MKEYFCTHHEWYWAAIDPRGVWEQNNSLTKLGESPDTVTQVKKLSVSSQNAFSGTKKPIIPDGRYFIRPLSSLESLQLSKTKLVRRSFPSLLASHMLLAWSRGGFSLGIWENWLQSVSAASLKVFWLWASPEGIFNISEFCGKN